MRGPIRRGKERGRSNFWVERILSYMDKELGVMSFGCGITVDGWGLGIGSGLWGFFGEFFCVCLGFCIFSSFDP
jgi:hypothetical protein